MSISTQTLVTFLNNAGSADCYIKVGDDEFPIDKLCIESVDAPPGSTSGGIKLLICVEKEVSP